MTAYDDIMREFREFKRYTGDGLPGAPVNAPLPVGDPQSGPWNPKKAGLRAALGGLAQDLLNGIATVNGMLAAIGAARDAALADLAQIGGITNTGFAKTLYYDHRGALGAAATLYLPRVFASKKGSTSVVYTAAGTESARLPGYTELAIGGTQTLVYADLSEASSPFKAVAYASAVPLLTGQMVPIAVINAGKVTRWFFDGEQIESGLPRLYAAHPIILEGTTLLVPSGLMVGAAITDTLAQPTDRKYYKEIASFGVGAKTLYFDHAAFLLGADPWKVATYPENPSSSVTVPIIACYNGDLLNIAGVFVAGDVPGGRMANIQDSGKNTPELADYLYGGATVCDITDPDLIAAGFTKGVQTTTVTLNLYGTHLAEQTPGRWAFVRVRVQTDTSLNFGTPRAYWMANNVGVGNFNLSLEQRLSNFAAVYSGWGRMPDNAGIDGIVAGGVTQAGVDIRHCGVQIGYGSEARGWVSRTDFPAKGHPLEAKVLALVNGIQKYPVQPEFIYTPDMWLVEGRPQELYPSSMLEAVNDGDEIRMSVTSRSVGDGLPFVAVSSGESVRVDPASFGAAGEIALRLITQSSSNRWTRPVAIHKALKSALNGKAPKIHIMSDSLMYDTGVPYAMYRKMAALGMSPSFIGTITLLENGVDGSAGLGLPAGSIRGESRSGIEWAKYMHIDPGTPLPPGNEATYLGLPSTGRLGFNPYIRPSTGGDDPDHIKNGYVWDFDFYRTRWAVDLAVPDYVIVNLGTNDGGHYPLATALDYIDQSMRITVEQIRAALGPTTKICFIGNPLARSLGGDTRWNTTQVPTIKRLLQTEADIADSNTWVLPGWAHASREIGWSYNAGTTDPVTGMVTTTINDFLHPLGLASEQMAEMIVAWIACQEAGV